MVVDVDVEFNPEQEEIDEIGIQVKQVTYESRPDLAKYHARELLNYTVAELWDMLTGEFELHFDDGFIITNWKETVYSSYAWEFHRRYPNTPMLIKHHVGSILRNGSRLGSGTHLTLLGNTMWSTHDIYMQDPTVNRDILSEMVYRLTNQMYVDLTYRLEEYVMSTDITDLMEVIRHPKIQEIKDRMEPTKQSIKITYDEIREVLNNGNDLPINPISLAVRSKLVNEMQILQCIGPRGFLTDIDSDEFRHPVMRGYGEGIRLFHDSLIESRSAAKSLLFSKSPLQEAEYFSRRLQLMSQIVQNLHHGDCGTTDYVLWHVRDKQVYEGTTVFAGDLKSLEGKHYLHDDGTLHTIRDTDKHLIGQSLKVRSVLHCAHPDPYGICSTCFGELSLSVPDGSNIGHMCCTSMTQKSSQSVLSVKHLDGSSTIESIRLRQDVKKYLAVASDGNSYLMANAIRNKNAHLVIPANAAANLTDINNVRNIEDLNISMLSQITEMSMYFGAPQQGDPAPDLELNVSKDRRRASMTYGLLNYIRQYGWSSDDFGNYVINMDKWDWSQPIMSLPLKHFNMSDHSKEIADMLESSVKEMKKRDKGVSPDAFLVEFADAVNSRLNVNLAVLEVTLYGAMIVSAEKQDYRLPKPGTERGLGVMETSMDRRSLSAAMAYEGQYYNFIDPYSFLLTNRPNHLLDGVLLPELVYGKQKRAPSEGRKRLRDMA